MHSSKFTNKKLTSETENRDIQISLTEGDRQTQSPARRLHDRLNRQLYSNQTNPVRMILYNQNEAHDSGEINVYVTFLKQVLC